MSQTLIVDPPGSNLDGFTAAATASWGKISFVDVSSQNAMVLFPCCISTLTSNFSSRGAQTEPMAAWGWLFVPWISGLFAGFQTSRVPDLRVVHKTAQRHVAWCFWGRFEGTGGQGYTDIRSPALQGTNTRLLSCFSKVKELIFAWNKEDLFQGIIVNCSSEGYVKSVVLNRIKPSRHSILADPNGPATPHAVAGPGRASPRSLP